MVVTEVNLPEGGVDDEPPPVEGIEEHPAHRDDPDRNNGHPNYSSAFFLHGSHVRRPVTRLPYRRPPNVIGYAHGVLRVEVEGVWV